MAAEVTALEEKLVKARQVKAGMMSELLGGLGWCECTTRGRIILVLTLHSIYS